MTFGPANAQSSFLPIEFDIPSDDDLARELISKRERLTATIVNVKQNGQYELLELLSAQQWFSTGIASAPNKPRYGFRQVYSFGAIAPGATLLIPTTIPVIAGQTLFFTLIRGSCVTNVPDFRPIPYSSATAVNQQIEIKVDTVNITIINGAGAPAIVSGIVVLEYLKN